METRYEQVRRLLNDRTYMDGIGLSLPQIAKRIGVSVPWMYKIKRGVTINPPSTQIDALHQFLVYGREVA